MSNIFVEAFFTVQKVKFSIKDFLNKYDKIADLVTFTEEILTEKRHGLCGNYENS